MSVGSTWFKLWVSQSVKAPDGTLSYLKLTNANLSPQVGTQLLGSTIEFEFVQVQSSTTETLTSAVLDVSK